MPDITTPEDEIDFEIVTNASQLAEPPPLAQERVILPGWRTRSGKAVAFIVWELSALDFGEFQDSTRVYDGQRFVGINLRHEDLKLLAAAIRDANGNRLWQTADAAIAQLGRYGQASIDKLLAAAQRVNRENNIPADAEGNSEPTPSGS